MTRDVITVHTAQNVSDACQALADNQMHHLPVVSGDELVGMISTADIMKLSLEAYGTPDSANAEYLDSQLTIEQVMSADISTVGPDDPIRLAAEKLSTGERHSVAVVDKGGDLVGIVTTTDLVGYLLAQY